MLTYKIIPPLFLQAVLLYSSLMIPNLHFQNDPSVGVFGRKFQKVQRVRQREWAWERFKEAWCVTTRSVDCVAG